MLLYFISDVMDFVNDSLSSSDYLPEEDPKLYESKKTGRGPLQEDWIDDCLKKGKPIMCAYKLCKVCFLKNILCTSVLCSNNCILSCHHGVVVKSSSIS